MCSVALFGQESAVSLNVSKDVELRLTEINIKTESFRLTEVLFIYAQKLTHVK